jgi:hypothetical protein
VDESVEIRVSPHARRWRLTAPWGQPAQLVVPRRMSRREIAAVIASQATWIAGERERQVPRLGLASVALTERQGRSAARALVEVLAAPEASALGVSYERIAIRDQRTRWGSCSSRGTLSFNWRLVLAPPEVMDYVVVHELCHLRHPDHSPRFWRLVEERRPGFAAQRTWLREHGAELRAFKPRETSPAT